MAAFSKPQGGVMSLLVILFTILHVTVALQHHAHHHPKRTEMDAHLEKRANNVAITGVCSTRTNAQGECQSEGRQSAPRLEIRELQKNEDQWNLYLLGMERFKAKPKNDRMSYYQIAGVHGRPYVTWNNFGDLVNRAGFCPHEMVLFGSWHRPYLALFEQALYESIQEVISEFPSGQQQRWRNAASTLRMPYWDWAAAPASGQPTVPTSIRDHTVSVTKPNGRVSIANPLYSYTWGDSLPSEMGGGPWNGFATTLRRPVANPTRSNNNEMNAQFGRIRLSLRDRLYGLFSSRQSWGFASTGAIGVRTDRSGSGVDSFESVHDAIHVTAGGESIGHMYLLDYSAFDPIFWLHHTNVDRLLAMYQHIVPNTWVANGNINHPMAQWNQGEAKNQATPLKPFTKNSRGDYYTSIDVKETRTLGYYYPETRDRSASQVAREVSRLYGAGRSMSAKRDIIEDIADTVDDVTDAVGDVADAVGDVLDEVKNQFDGRPFREGDYHTVMSIIADKYVMSGSYSVHCFLDSPEFNSTAPSSNTTAPDSRTNATLPSNGTSGAGSSAFINLPSYVGAYGILGGTHVTADMNATYPVITEGVIPLTTALQGAQESGHLASLSPDDVTAYLKKHLSYKVIGPNGVELNPEDIPNFHIYVKSCPVTPAASDDELPSWGNFTEMPDATEHLPAGLPFVYEPTPIDIPLPEGYDEPIGEMPSGLPHSPSDLPSPVVPEMPEQTSSLPAFPTGVFPYPVLPWEEEGYCVSEQTIEYVDEQGNFLYRETA